MKASDVPRERTYRTLAPQAVNAPSGGGDPRKWRSAGAPSGDGPPLAASTPKGGSAVHAVTSEGAITL